MKKKIFIMFIGIILLTTIYSGCLEEKSEIQKEKPYKEIATNFFTYLKESNYQKASALFSFDMKNALSETQLETLWESYISMYGALDSIQNSTLIFLNNYENVYVNCSFENDYLLIFKLVFNNEKQIIGFWLENTIPFTAYDYNTPVYVNETQFVEIDLTIGAKPWMLPATLSIPNSTGPFPCVILIHGSGPNDRDESIGPNKPFKDLAWGLASKEIAVLRFDKRTFIYADEISHDKNFTVKEEVIDDVIQAIKFLKVQSYVPINSIFLLGHSLGGMMIPQILQQNPSSWIQGGILLAAPARPLEDLILNQTIYLSNQDGVIDDAEQKNIDTIQNYIQQIKNGTINETERVLGVNKAYWDYLNSYDQVATAQSLNESLFILQGKRDYQVSYDKDYLTWVDALSAKEQVLFQSYDSLNHLFIAGQGLSNNSEYMQKGHVNQTIVEDIATWIKIR